jgi:hypothetical protein
MGSVWWEISFGHATLFMKIGAVFGPALAATTVYFGVTMALKIPAAGEMLGLLLGKPPRQAP